MEIEYRKIVVNTGALVGLAPSLQSFWAQMPEYILKNNSVREIIMYRDENYQYLSVKQVAELLGFHPETIKRWARDGKIEFQQAGHYGHIRVKWPLKKPGLLTKSNKLLQRRD